jgi:energy-coupling factor transporter transmembrane protein EcfT
VVVLASSWPTGEELLIALLVVVVLPAAIWLLCIVASVVFGVIWVRKLRGRHLALRLGPPAGVLGVVLFTPLLVAGIGWLASRPPPPEPPPEDCAPDMSDPALIGTPCDIEDLGECTILNGFYCSQRFHADPGEPTHICEALCLWDCDCPPGHTCMNANCRPEDDPFAW